MNTKETWFEFKRLCPWHGQTPYVEVCSRGERDLSPEDCHFNCMENLCPRIKKNTQESFPKV